MSEERPTTLDAYVQASQDFNKARNKAILSRIQHFIHASRDELLSFSEVKEILKPSGEYYRGMQLVPVNRIVGSEGRYHDFNRYFLPRSDFLRARWERVDRAHITDVPLPAIQLYEIGGVYFVRDGNHRVSVARAQGVELIDAEVISLSSGVTLDPSMTTDDLRASVIAYEKKLFYDKTRFGALTGDDHLDFTTPGRYDVIYTHILGHKYYLNQNTPAEIPFDTALVSWYREVYRPIIDIITEHHTCDNFPGQSPSDLYVWIVKHWDFLKKKNGLTYPVSEAARDYTARYGQKTGGIGGLLRRLTRKD